MLENHHIPVLLKEVKQYLLEENNPKEPNAKELVFFDGTLGGGGYTKMILESSPKHKVIASDLDSLAIDNFWSFTDLDKEIYSERVQFIQNSFLEAIKTVQDKSLAGMVLDLGFSSNQMEVAGRGFAYLAKDQNEPFDLRFDQNSGEPVYNRIKTLKSQIELGNIIFNYSGEKFARKIATSLFNEIKQTPKNSVVTVAQAVQAIVSAIPKQFHHKQNSILSRVWQALRIWTNNELEILEEFLPVAMQKLCSGGRLVVVDFHSLEDKIVTKWMRQMATPTNVDRYGEKTFIAKLKTRKGVEPTPEEIAQNPRSRSATLRCLEKI